MPSATDSRTKRLLDLVVLLLDVKHPVPFTELREQFAEYRTAKPEAGQRAFERDKATLIELGVPIRWIGAEEGSDTLAEGGYIIDRQKYRLPEVTLTADEVAALVVTASAARHQPEFPYRHAAEMAVRKLMFDLAGLGKGRGQGRLGGRRQAGPDAAPLVPVSPPDVLIHMPSTYRSRSLGDYLAQLEEAVRLRKRVTLRYDHHRPVETPPKGLPVQRAAPAVSKQPSQPAQMPQGVGMQGDGGGVPQPMPVLTSERWYVSSPPRDAPQQSTRDVDPYGLVYRQGAWLLVGHCHLAHAVRRFRVDRILELKIAPRPRSPDFEVPADFSLQEHGSFSPWRFEREPPVTTRLWVSAETPWVSEEDFGTAVRSGPIFDGDTEGMVVEFPCTNPDYLVSRVLGAAGALRVLSPSALRRRLMDAASAVARRNNGLDQDPRNGQGT